MKRILFEFLFLIFCSIVSGYYYIKGDYWFALIMTIPVGAIVIGWCKINDSEKVEDTK